jgi:hypothetical protein
VSSQPPEANVLPSGFQATEQTSAECPLRHFSSLGCSATSGKAAIHATQVHGSDRFTVPPLLSTANPDTLPVSLSSCTTAFPWLPDTTHRSLQPVLERLISERSAGATMAPDRRTPGGSDPTLVVQSSIHPPTRRLLLGLNSGPRHYILQTAARLDVP